MRLPILLTAFALMGCVNNSTNSALDVGSNQVQLRQIQSRAFDTTDKAKTLRTIIAVLQDLGFVIDKADLELGTVTATKLDGYALRMSVSVRPRGTQQLMVRANGQYQEEAVTDPAPYQSFFNSLAKGMFLTAQNVD
ncbi:MAG: hypothetical protein RLZZ233_808 [Verrucomicrobiota bacterium]|jgi:hypothetical protein